MVAAKRRAFGIKLMFLFLTFVTTHPSLTRKSGSSMPPSLAREGFIETDTQLSKYNLLYTHIDIIKTSLQQVKNDLQPSLLLREKGDHEVVDE